MSTARAAVETRDQALRTRAQRVIPGGMYGHQSAASLPPEFPQFMERGRGSRVWDVDGREYLDFMCSFGPIVLGHAHPRVEAAVAAQRALADCQNGPSPRMVELAERLVALTPHADWAMFAKNGTDATTLAVSIARAAAGRAKVLVARGAYHGSAPWCTPRPAGVTPEDRAHLLTYTYNDLASVESAADQAGTDLAAVLVSAFRHDARYDQELVDPAFARGVRALCDRRGAALILDDVRAGFRLHLGGSWAPLGVRPDLAAYSKAIANGYPLAAVAGADALREAATRVFATGSFWFAAVPMAAALATLQSLEEEELAEAYLVADQLEPARASADRGLKLIRERGEPGYEAWALRLLGEIASHPDHPDAAAAEVHYGAAMALASELGMRPLVAHGHLGLGRLSRRAGDAAGAREHLATATALYREMGMGLWLERAAATVR